MMRKHSLTMMMVLALVLVSSVAWGQSNKEDYPAIYSDRPLTVANDMYLAGMDFGLGLNKGRVAKDINLGVNFTYGILKNLEIGADITAMNYASGASGAKFGGAAIFARYELLTPLSFYFDIHFPGGGLPYVDDFGNQLLGVKLGAESKYNLILSHLFIYGGLYLDVGFAKEAVAGQSPQLGLVVDFGVGANAMKELWFDLNMNAVLTFRPDAGSLGDRTDIPLALKVGSTPIDPLDIYLAFVLPDLNPAAGGAIDNRGVLLGAKYRF